MEKVESSDWFNGTYKFETYENNQPSWKSFSRAIWKDHVSNSWVIGNLKNRGTTNSYINSSENSAYHLPENCTNWNYTKTSSHGTTSTDITLKCLEGRTHVYIILVLVPLWSSANRKSACKNRKSARKT